MEAAAVCISGALLMFTHAIARQSNSAGVRTRNSELHSARKRPANGRNDTFFMVSQRPSVWVPERLRSQRPSVWVPVRLSVSVPQRPSVWVPERLSV